MKNKQYDNLQYVFACLFTHSHWAHTIRQDFKQVNHYFDLSADDNTLLYEFIFKHFKKILTTAILAEEKRWREMLTTIKYTSTLLAIDKLKKYWDDYLLRFSPIEPIPATPIHESVAFLSYLLKHPLEAAIKPIAEYVYFRNITFAYKFYTLAAADCIELTDFDLSHHQLLNLKPKINPSFISKIFDDALKQIFPSETSNCPDYIGFYKNIKTAKVNRIHLSEASFAFLMSVPSHGNVMSLIQNFSQTSRSNLLHSANMIKKLHHDGVILLTHLI